MKVLITNLILPVIMNNILIVNEEDTSGLKLSAFIKLL